MFKHLLNKTKSGILVLPKLILHGTTDWFDYAVIQHSTACNRRCPYCPQATHPTDQQLMPMPLFELAIRRLRESRFVGLLSFDFYNESMMDDRLKELVRLAKSQLPFARIAIFTNGDFLTLPVAAELLSAGMSYFVVSSHGPVDQLKRRIQPVIERYGHRVRIADINSGQTGLLNRGGAVAVNGGLKRGCRLTQLIIDVNGQVLLCCNDFFKTVKMGDIHSQTLGKIWMGKYANIRRDLRAGRQPLPVCQNCNVW